MELRCSCAGCGAGLRIPVKYAGRKVRCPKCQAIVPVPESTFSSTSPTLDPQAPVPLPESLLPPEAVPSEPAPSVSPPHAITEPADPAQTAVAESAAAISQQETPSISAPATPDLVRSDGSGEAEPSFQLQIPREEADPVRRRRRSQAKRPLPQWVIATVAACTVAAILLGAYFALRPGSTGGSSSGGPIAVQSASGQTMGTLVIDLSATEREEAVVLIDRRKMSLPESGPIAYPLLPGRHRITLQRRGYEPYEQSVQIGAAERATIRPEWQQSRLADIANRLQDGKPAEPLGYERWISDFEQAQKQAEQQKKDLLLAFIDSTRSREGLTQEVFGTSEFLEGAERTFVLVVLDFPDPDETFGFQPELARNDELRRDLAVDEFPTVVLADATGRAYAVPEYEEGTGPTAFLRTLDKQKQLRAERDELLNATKSGEMLERLAAAEKCLEWLGEQGLVPCYSDELARWRQWALQADPQNDKGLLEKFFEIEWMVRLAKLEPRDARDLLSVMRELEPWQRERKFQDPDRAVRLFLIAAQVLARLGEVEEAARYVAAGEHYQPNDRELVSALQTAARALRNHNVLGSGTAFVVAPAGYLLTNHHVIEGPGLLQVRLPDQEEPVAAKVIATDRKRDIALIQVDAASSLAPVPFSSQEVGRGASVAAFGYPLGDAIGSSVKLAIGTVSALPDRSADGMILLDCRINPGNSGGPLCNAYGQVVGMVTAKSRGGFGVDSYGMALPVSDLTPFLKKHLPSFEPAPVPDSPERLDWEQVDQRVSPGVVMVLKVQE